MNRSVSFRSVFVFLSVATILIAWAVSQRQFSFNFDSQNKIYQSYSFVQNEFRSEALYYPGKDIDPEGNFNPAAFTVLLDDGRKVSAFPAAFAFLATPFVIIDRHFGHGMELASLLSLLPLLCIWLLLLRWKLPTSLLMTAFWGNFLWLQSFEFSEYLLATFLAFAGYTVFFNGKEKPGITRPLLAGVLLGLAVFFRHEAIGFGLALIGSALTMPALLRIFKQETTDLRRSSLLAAGFLSLLLTWALWNAMDYGHVLGPRFLANKDTQFPGIKETLWRYSVLYFGGGLKFGLFTFIPLLIVPLIEPLFRLLRRQNPFAEEGSTEKITLLAIIVYLIVIPLMVPNDGVGGFGPRYLIFAVLPGYVLIKRWMERYPSRRARLIVLFFALISLPLPVWLHRVHEKGMAHQRYVHADYRKTSAGIWIFPNLDLYYYAGLDTVRYESYIAPSPDKLVDLIHRLKVARPEKTIAVVSLNRQMAEIAKANLAADESLLGKTTLRIVLSALRDLEAIKKQHPDSIITSGAQVDVLKLKPE